MRKYKEEIDRESAYEILGGKVTTPARKDTERRRMGDGEMQTPVAPRSKTTTAHQKSELDPVIKVLTSATFIRGVFGILSKTLR